MARKIRFRGKDNKGQWHFGYFYEECDNTYIIDDRNSVDGCSRNIPHKVDPNTIGQYTGMKDKNGKEVYEGDVVVKHYFEDDLYTICNYIEEYACFAFIENVKHGEKYYFQKCDEKSLEIIGNICDNPELLKEEEE